MYSLNKLEAYSRISTLGPAGHCTSHFKRAVCISCQPCVDVHKGRGGPAHVDACGQGVKNVIFFVDVINRWPLMILCQEPTQYHYIPVCVCFLTGGLKHLTMWLNLSFQTARPLVHLHHQHHYLSPASLLWRPLLKK